MAKQQFDSKGRTAAQLSIYAGMFTEQAAETFINLLSRGYSNQRIRSSPEDPSLLEVHHQAP